MDLELITNSKFISKEPYTIELCNEKMILELKSDTSGFEWSDNKYIILDTLTEMDSNVNLKIEFYNGNEITSLGYYLLPNRRVKVAIKLDELESKRWFLQTRPGTFKGHVAGKPTHISQIDKLRIVLEKGKNNRTFTLFNLYISEELPDLTVIGEPLVDEMGQCIDMDWEGKTKTTEQLVAFLKNELAAVEDNVGYGNKSWSKYGGWKQIQFEKKGYFYIHNDGKRWWLVDPEGYAFFSNGVCYGSRMGDHGFVDGMENMFQWLPSKEDEAYKIAWTTADKIAEYVKRNGIEEGRGKYLFNFARANMIRAFGDGWWNAWNKINVARLKKWGFNTISVCVNNYMDENVMEYLEKAQIPFTWTLKEFPKTDKMIFRDFPDVYDPEYKKRSEIFAEQLKPFVGNPYLIGYFINNEPEWLVQHDVNPAERLLANKNKLYSKIEFINFIRNKYKEDILAFNKSWNLNLSSFEDLYTPMEAADKLSQAAEKDLLEYRDILIKKYVDVPNQALKNVDPVHMSLGMRYASITEEDFSGANLYDLFSFNCYRQSPSEKFDIALKHIEKPIIVGEWHIGGSDKGLYANGLVSASTQTERGKCCAYYMQTAMSYSNCIGIHYFEFNDQPLLGRFDGENMQHGLIDVCNKPYYDCVEKIQETNLKMYEIINGDIQPTAETGVYVKRY
jgi:hypothetical protein